MTRATLRTLLIAAMVLSWPVAAAVAQPFPDRPVRLVIPYLAGASSNDILGRALAQRLSERWGVNVVVDNRPGAGGHIGTDLVAKSPADGYTLLLATNGILVISPHVYRKLPYDAVRDLTPVTLFSFVTYTWGVTAGLPVSNVKELIALAKARPGQLTAASSGNGSTPHLCLEMFKMMTGTDIIHVPYKAGAIAVTDLVSGQVQMYCAGVPTLLQQLKAGRVRTIGIASRKRSALMPEVATFEEQGLKGFDVSSWTAIMVPAKTPPALVERLHRDIAAVMETADMKAYVQSQGAEAAAIGPKALADYLRDESRQWAEVIKAAKVKID